MGGGGRRGADRRGRAVDEPVGGGLQRRRRYESRERQGRRREKGKGEREREDVWRDGASASPVWEAADGRRGRAPRRR
jgi:hypothetical protein